LHNELFLFFLQYDPRKERFIVDRSKLMELFRYLYTSQIWILVPVLKIRDMFYSSVADPDLLT
jgi:hypothetical protein